MNLEPETLPQRHDTGLPGVDELVELPRCNAKSAKLIFQ